MRQARASLVFLFTAVLAATAAGQARQSPAAPPAGPIDRLLVCNKADHTLSIFDPTSRRELAVLKTGEGPHEVAVSPDGRTAVISDYGAQKPGRTLTIVDVLAAKVVKTIDLAQPASAADPDANKGYLRPHGCVFLSGDHVAVTSESTRQLLFVDISMDRVYQTMATPQSTMHMVAGVRGRHFLAATSIRDGSVALFDTLSTTRQDPKVVKTGEGAEGLAVNPITGEVWVGNRAADTLSIVDAEKAAVTATLTTGDFPFRIVFTPDGSRALVSCAESGEVQIFDAAAKKLLLAISIAADGSELGAMPMGLCTDPEGRLCYVACGRGEFIAVLDLQQNKAIERIKAGKGPDGIAFARITGE